MKKALYLSIVSAAMACTGMFASCSSDEPAPAPEFTDLSMSEAESRANAGLAEFNDRYFDAVMNHTTQQNFAVSPLGASMMLSLTCNMTDAEVTSQILEALGSSDVAALNTLSQRYIEVLPRIDSNVTMTLATGCWYSNRYTLATAFGDVLTGNYYGNSRSADFAGAPQDVAADINAWVNDRTRGMIPSIYNPAGAEGLRQQSSVLVNALYIKGAWCEPFEAEETKPATFHGAVTETTVDMMHRVGDAYYQDGENFAAMRLPLGDGTFNVTFVLPDEGTTVEDLIAGNIHSKLHFTMSETVKMFLPKVDYLGESIPMDAVFRSMGMTRLEEMREVSMFTEPVEAMQTFKQKTAVRFNEEGAEASSVTWDDMVSAPGPDAEPEEPVIFRADRPYLFFIDAGAAKAAIIWGCFRQL